MLDIQQKRKLRSVMYHKVTLGIIFVLVLLSAHSTWLIYKKKVSSDEMKKVAQEMVIGLTQRKDDLDSKIEQFGTVSGIEEEIRSKFSVAKDNEKMVIVLPTEEKISSTTSTQKSFWASIVALFR